MQNAENGLMRSEARGVEGYILQHFATFSWFSCFFVEWWVFFIALWYICICFLGEVYLATNCILYFVARWLFFLAPLFFGLIVGVFFCFMVYMYMLFRRGVFWQQIVSCFCVKMAVFLAQLLYRIQNTEYRIQNTNHCQNQEARSRFENTEYKIQNTECRTLPNPLGCKYRIQNA